MVFLLFGHGPDGMPYGNVEGSRHPSDQGYQEEKPFFFTELKAFHLFRVLGYIRIERGDDRYKGGQSKDGHDPFDRTVQR